MSSRFELNGRRIGVGEATYVIAEMSANHNQSYEEAVSIMRAAKEAGADAIKLQTYTADTMTLGSNEQYFQIGKGTIWEGRNLYDLYREAYTPWEWQPKLKALAEDLELDLFSTPFDASAVDFLEEMNVPAYKVASFELVDLPLIEKIARTGKPMIMSTGMATVAEIEEAVQAARNAGAIQIALLKCTSAYPAPPDEMNLRTIPHLVETFQVPVGLSDHTMGIAVPVASVALGACIIEKHLTLSRWSLTNSERWSKPFASPNRRWGTCVTVLPNKKRRVETSGAHYLLLGTSKRVKSSQPRISAQFDPGMD